MRSFAISFFFLSFLSLDFMELLTCANVVSEKIIPSCNKPANISCDAVVAYRVQCATGRHRGQLLARFYGISDLLRKRSTGTSRPASGVKPLAGAFRRRLTSIPFRPP